jgi:lipopolysaccharide export system permease protein
MVIARYISKEIITTFLALVFILLFIAISNKFVMFLAKAASGKLSLGLVFKIVGLYIPELFAIMAPVAMFIAILFTHSRLHTDSEVAVLLTSGFDWAHLTRITLMVAGGVAVLVAIINFIAIPIFSVKREQLVANGQVAGVVNAITPGRFQTIEDNDHLVFYVENVLPDGELQNIFIAQQPTNDKQDADKSVVVLTAKTASVKQQEDPNEFYLVLRNGYRYVGVPGTANYSVTSFAEYGRQLKYPVSAGANNNDNMRGTREILQSNAPKDLAEFQWRCAMPIALMLLAMIAIPLAKVQPRQGRYAKFLPAVLIYMLYYNLLTVVRRYIANGTFPSFPGMWVVHIAFFVFAIFLLLQVSGRLAEFRYRLQNS